MPPPTPRRSTAPELERILPTASLDQVKRWLDAVPGPADRAAQLDALTGRGAGLLGDLLDDDAAEELLSSVDALTAARTVMRLDPVTAARLVGALNSDLAADIVRETPKADREPLLEAMPDARAIVLRDLLGRPEESAAAHMVPEVLAVATGATAEEAIAVARGFGARGADSQTGAYVYVVSEDGRLVGVAAFRALVLSAPGTLISEVMTAGPRRARQDEDAETAARLLLDHRLLALPVVDENDRLVGIMTADAAADIVEDEATDDAERQGGSQPLEVPYLAASPWRLWRKRIVWLLVLFVAEAYTGTVLQVFEHELDAVVSLAFFIPLLIGTGGNTGTQITTTIVRAVSMRQVRLRNLRRVLVKELSTAGLIALSMAAAGLVRAFTLNVGWEVVLVVSLTLAAIVVWAALVASVLPLLLTKTRVDPAVVSGPMIATIVDGTGLIIYFLIAKALLPQLAGL